LHHGDELHPLVSCLNGGDGGGHVEVCVLGCPRVLVDGVAVSLTGRALLLTLRLALALPRALPTERLLHDVWPEASPMAGTVRVAISRLRAALGAETVQHRDGGYALSSAVGLDARRFADLVRSARDRGTPLEQRLNTYDEALRMWAGPAFDGFDRLEWIGHEAVHLDDLREHAIDERFELGLLSGDSTALLTDLRSAHDRSPMRERRSELLATALYRVGRQAEALAVLGRTRRVLRDELGLDPAPSLRELERRILSHDETLRLDPAAARASSTAEIESHLRAATTLARTGAYDDALAIVDQAAQIATRTNDRRSIALCLLARASAEGLAGRSADHQLIDGARAIARELRDGQLLARCALTRFGSGVPDDKQAALVELTEPLELLPRSAPEQVELLCAAAAIVTFTDGSHAADRLLEAAEHLYRGRPDVRTEATWLATRAIIGSVRGLPTHAVDEWATRSYELALTTDDPRLKVVTIQALLRSRYSRGDLNGVAEVLDELEQSSRQALISFGLVRVLLCRSTAALLQGELDRVHDLIAAARAEGRRLRTFAAEGATKSQELILLRELGFDAEIRSIVRELADQRPPGVWNAVLAVTGDVHEVKHLASIAPQVAANDTRPSFAAYAAEVAARHGDAPLGKWCSSLLDPLGDTMIMVGLGSVVLNAAPFYAGLGRLATGDVSGAVSRLERALSLTESGGAHLWRGHAAVELAEALRRSGDPNDRARAEALVASVVKGPVVTQSVSLRRRVDEVRAALASHATID
jgi:DNA-binding SARP family transcriptional activator